MAWDSYQRTVADMIDQRDKLHARIAQLEKQLSDEQQWRVDAQRFADKLQAEVGELEGLLRECEWVQDDTMDPPFSKCPLCYYTKVQSHANDCRLAAALRD